MTKYSQRQWERTVGWGKVPKEYNIKESNKDERIQPQDDKSPRDKSNNN